MKSITTTCIGLAASASIALPVSAQVNHGDQWRLGLGHARTPYVSAQNAAVAPSTNSIVELGWSRSIAGPWSLRTTFMHAAESDRQTQRTTNFLNGTTEITDTKVSTRAQLFQVGLGYAFVDGPWGRLTATGMLTHTRGELRVEVTDTTVTGGQVTAQEADAWPVRRNTNRLAVGLEYQGPQIAGLGGTAPYLSVQRFTANNGAGGKQTFAVLGLVHAF